MRRALALAMILASGCMGGLRDQAAVVSNSQFNRFKPAPPPLTPEAIVVQYIQIERTEGDSVINDNAWRQGDEQFLPPKLRGDLARNGVRAARLSDRLGSEMIVLLQKSNEKGEGQARQLAAGTKLKIQMTTLLPTWTLFTFQNDAPKGEKLERAQGFFRISPTLIGGSKVHLAITPEIEFGDELRTPVVAENLSGFDIRSAKPSRVFNDLKIDVDLANGEFFLLGCLPEQKGTLGQTLFTHQAKDARIQTVLLIRAMRPTREDLFQAGYDANDFFLTPNKTQAAARSPVRDTLLNANPAGR